MNSVLNEILTLARWAPSGDNSQSWRFESVGPFYVVVHGVEGWRDGVYDLHGHMRQVGIGTLIKTMAIASTSFGLRINPQLRNGGQGAVLAMDVYFETGASIATSPLLPFIAQRTVQRRPMRTTPLTTQEKTVLEASLMESGFHVTWFSRPAERLRMAALMFLNAKLRLTMPEAYEVHKHIIRWNSIFSEDAIPDRALGASRLTLKTMQFAMKSWPRIQWLNRYFAGTLMPRIEMDFVPSLACAAHFAIIAPASPVSIEDRISAGRAIQKFWLTATSLGLHQQPEMTPLIFSGYVHAGVRFTKQEKLLDLAKKIQLKVSRLLGPEQPRAVWLARIGHGAKVNSRSTRLPLSQLTIDGQKTLPP